MKAIRFRVASRKYRSKLDFKNAYEQIRLALESVAKSGFITPSGTFVSRVMQQGDTNAPDTMHRVSHIRYLDIVFQTLRHYRFFLSRSKVDLLAPQLEALGSIIDDSGISVDPSKMDAILHPARRSQRNHRSPSFGPSDLNTFLTAQRSLTRSTRFANLPPTSPSDLPMDPLSVPLPADVLSDTAGAWLGDNAASVASSHRSAKLLTRRHHAQEAFEAAAAQRRAEFLAEEERLKQEMDEAMSVADVKSEAGRKNPRPEGSAVEAEAEVMRRRLEDLKREAEALERLIAQRATGLRPRPSPSSSTSPSPLPSIPRLATFGIKVKVKVKEPKPWTGEFDMVKREGWIKTAALYLAGLELDVEAVLDEHLTPFPFYTIRSLFSSEAANGSISPQAWFDARNGRIPFTSVQGVFEALRSHWADDHAAEQALSRYRAARQGNLRARDFGAALDALADACFDRKIDDLDRRTTFVVGLQAQVQDFVRTQLASLKALGKPEATFDEVVRIAALTDGLASFSSKKQSPLSSSPQPGSKKTSTNDLSPSPSKPSFPSPRPATTCTQDALNWQSKHPAAGKADWFDARAHSTNKPVRCYNCGEIGSHFSRSCTASRKDPKGVIVAMLSKLRISSLSTPSSPSSTPSIATSNWFTPLDERGKRGRGLGSTPSVPFSSVSTPPPSSSPASPASSSLRPIDSPSAPIETSSLTLSSLVEPSATAVAPPSVSPGHPEEGAAPGLDSKEAQASGFAPLLESVKKKRKRAHSSKSFSLPPEVADSPLTIPSWFSAKGINRIKGTSLIDSGAQADVLSPDPVHRMGLEVRRLVAPVHADLAADGQQVRLSLFASANVTVGNIVKKGRSFFVLPLPSGIDAILGVPWLKDAGVAVSASSLFVALSGPSEKIFDFNTGCFVEQPDKNFEDLGFVKRSMMDDEFGSFTMCAIRAGVEPALVQEAVESIDLEPHNPLLDIPDDEDPSADLSEEEADEQLTALLSEFDDIFVDSLPGPPPFRPINHRIVLMDDEKKIRPHVIRMPDRYKAQWTAHLRKFVDSGFWSPAALDSACAMFAVPKHDKTQA
ncbi:hypothetical protein JCM11641_006551 [Rhodosporidiobolus odoratus]